MEQLQETETGHCEWGKGMMQERYVHDTVLTLRMSAAAAAAVAAAADA